MTDTAAVGVALALISACSPVRLGQHSIGVHYHPPLHNTVLQI